MSLDDIKAIDWQHFDLNKLPQYLLVSFVLIILGVLLILTGLLL